MRLSPKFAATLAVLFILAACDGTTSAEKTQTTKTETVAESVDEGGDRAGQGEAEAGEETIPMETVEKEPVPDDAQKTVSAEIDPALVMKGKDVYERVCVTCHGREGQGEVFEGQPLFSFGTPADEWTNGPTVDGIMKTLREGVHQTSMKEFGELSMAEAKAVSHYVLHLREQLIEPEDAAQ